MNREIPSFPEKKDGRPGMDLEWEWGTLKTNKQNTGLQKGARDRIYINNVGSNLAQFQASGFGGKHLEAFLFPWAGIGNITSRKLI